jgi:hypothetical protein
MNRNTKVKFMSRYQKKFIQDPKQDPDPDPKPIEKYNPNHSGSTTLLSGV